MNIHLDAALGRVVWLALSLGIGVCAACLALAWLELAPTRGTPARLRRLLGAGISLGTGLWAMHGLSAAITPGGLAAGIEFGAELAIWGMGIVIGIAALGWPDSRTARLPQRLLAGFGLASSAIALQAVGALVSARADLVIEWHAAALVGAWLACLGACLAAMGLSHAARAWSRRGRSRARAGAGVLIGAGLVLSHQGVMHAAGLTLPDTVGPIHTDALPALALLGSAIVLFASSHVLRQQMTCQAARAAARHKRDTHALNDPLTGLPTRQLFEGALSQAVRRADTDSHRLALLLINLDGFKPINEGFGHLGGDRVLREVAARLRALSMPHGAARLGGDEFLMLLAGNPEIIDASALATSVIASIGAPFKVDGRAATLSCSIGVAMYPEHGAKSTMISHAQAAMVAAKAAGGAVHAFFEPRMIKGMREDAELLRDLRVALERGQLELYYQPKIHAPSGEITGAEALMRWHHPQRGMISPAVFIPIAERFGLINAMGRWVIEEACRQARAWRDEGLRMRVAINLSVHQLRQPDLAAWIDAALQRNQINPDLITCEVTESSAMDDTDVTMRVLGELDRVGVHLSIDDFGTGHSSLSVLRKLPADELKIDRSFVLDLETSEDARKVALAVINLAKSLNLKVVAEGVETEGQNRILREFGCDQLQGYLFAKPMSAKALALWAMDDVGPRTMNFRDSLFRETTPMVG